MALKKDGRRRYFDRWGYPRRKCRQKPHIKKMLTAAWNTHSAQCAVDGRCDASCPQVKNDHQMFVMLQRAKAKAKRNNRAKRRKLTEELPKCF